MADRPDDGGGQLGQASDILSRRAVGNGLEAWLACEETQVTRWVRLRSKASRPVPSRLPEPGAGWAPSASAPGRGAGTTDWGFRGCSNSSPPGGADFFVSPRRPTRRRAIAAVDPVTVSGPQALRQGRTVPCVTARAVFRLAGSGLAPDGGVPGATQRPMCWRGWVPTGGGAGLCPAGDARRLKHFGFTLNQNSNLFRSNSDAYFLNVNPKRFSRWSAPGRRRSREAPPWPQGRRGSTPSPSRRSRPARWRPI